MTTSSKSAMADRNARRLAIVCVHLACCAIESSSGVDDFLDASTSLASDVELEAAVLNVLVVAGTVTRSNEHLVTEAYEKLPEPKVVVAFGVCAISGGPYWDSYAVRQGIGELVPIDVVVPGCPPAPADLHAVLTDLAQGSDVA